MNREADTYLTEDEVQALSGKKYPKVQAKALAERGWPLELRDGRVLILRAYHDQRLGLGKPARRRRPRLAGLAA